ncbi:MAG: hypothetical protein E6J11_03330 [Chloroflexi bacterium]|nr:MAG: hypothetical protein E6J22_05100 [Chloroflexota bacterium]TMD01387.1 MAG: hypothetical protein E6J11_03330 [Chloroflexota bacterium]
MQIAAFRAIWFASPPANVGTWFQNVGGVWLMTRFTTSPLLIALMQTATTLPVFLVGFPAGALADIVNRRLLVRVGAILAQRPGLPVALVFGILVVVLFVLDKHGVSIVGAIPRGLPLPSWPAIGFEEYLGSSPGTRHRARTLR